MTATLVSGLAVSDRQLVPEDRRIAALLQLEGKISLRWLELCMRMREELDLTQ